MVKSEKKGAIRLLGASCFGLCSFAAKSRENSFTDEQTHKIHGKIMKLNNKFQCNLSCARTKAWTHSIYEDIRCKNDLDLVVNARTKSLIHQISSNTY